MHNFLKDLSLRYNSIVQWFTMSHVWYLLSLVFSCVSWRTYHSGIIVLCSGLQCHMCDICCLLCSLAIYITYVCCRHSCLFFGVPCWRLGTFFIHPLIHSSIHSLCPLPAATDRCVSSYSNKQYGLFHYLSFLFGFLCFLLAAAAAAAAAVVVI